MFLLVLVLSLLAELIFSLDPLLIPSGPYRTTISNFLQNEITSGNDYLILTKDQINSKTLNSLNLKDLKSIKVQNDNILIPNNFKPIFLFNQVTNVSSTFTFDGFVNYAEFLLNTPPFNIPSFSTYDLNLLVPNKEKEHMASDNPFVKEGVPLLVFNLNNDQGENVSIESSSVEKLHKILNFDALTANWLKDFPVNKLIEGIFCNLSDEICINIAVDESNLLVFSLWEQRELTLPLTVLLNSNSIPREKSYKQVMQKHGGLRKGTIEKRYVKDNSFDDVQYMQKTLKTYFKSQRFTADPNPDPSNIADDIISQAKKIRLPAKSDLKHNFLSDQKNQVYGSKHQRRGNSVKKQNLASTRLAKSQNGSQKGYESETKEDCEPVTWSNVFHHSIFNNVNFCL